MGLLSGLFNLFPQRIKVQPTGSPLQQIVVPQARDRWLTTSVKSYTPDTIEGTLRGAFGGNLLAQWQLFDLMEETWPHLSKNLNELKRAVRSMELSVTPYTESGAQPTASAVEKAKLVERALRGMRPQPGSDQNDLGGTIYDLLDAWGKGITVLEIDWEQRKSPRPSVLPSPVGEGQDEGRRPSIPSQEIVVRDTRWIHPRYYGYSSFGSDLLLNVNQVETQLDPILENYNSPPIDIYNLQPVVGGLFAPFPENKFLISICKQKSGHPIGAALLRTLAWWWCASNFTTEWFLNYAQIFGQPFRWAEYDPNKPGLLQQISDMMENMGSSGWGAFPAGVKMEFKEAAKNSSENPHAFLIRFADKLCDILILGQTLSTDVGDGGSGSRALGQVHEGVRDDILEAAGDYVAGVFNAQLVPAICKLNYGEDVDELPSVLLGTKEVTDAVQLAERDQTLLNIPGVAVPKEWFYQRHDIPMPQEGEPVIQGGMRSPSPGGEGRDEGGLPNEKKETNPDPVTAKDASEQLAENVMEELTGVEHKWLAGIKPVFQNLVVLAKSSKITDEEFVKALEASRKKFPELFHKLDTKALSDAMEKSMGVAVVNGAARGFMNRGNGRKGTQRSQRGETA